MPYFAYISMLHLYESLGWWRAGAALRKVHFAEEWNELHHLQIMESLGGDNAWIDRFIASHSAVLYFWALIAFYALSPKHAYAFSELVEGHASDTYAGKGKGRTVTRGGETWTGSADSTPLQSSRFRTRCCSSRCRRRQLRSRTTRARTSTCSRRS